MLEARRREVVDPFYLQLMRLNAVECTGELADQIAIVAGETSLGDVLELLRSDWRPRVLGAWFAAARTEPELGDAVLASLDSSWGSLTSPPLVAAALVHPTSRTLPALHAYVERDLANQWGAARFAAAAVERLGGTAEDALARDEDRQILDAMLGFAARLRGT